MKRHQVLLGFLLLVSVGLSLSTRTIAQPLGAPDFSNSPDVSEGRVVWAQPGPEGSDIYLHDLATGQGQLIVDDSEQDSIPQISGNYVVYQQRDSFFTEHIMWYAIDSGETGQVSHFPLQFHSSFLEFDNDEGVVVFYDSGDVFLFDLVNDTTVQITDSSSVGEDQVHVSGNRLVWHRRTPDDIVAFDRVTGLDSVIAAGDSPRIFGENVVFKRIESNGDTNIYHYDLSSGGEQLLVADTGGLVDHLGVSQLAIDRDVVAWLGTGGDGLIHFMSLSAGAEAAVDVGPGSGDVISFSLDQRHLTYRYDETVGGELFAYDLCTTQAPGFDTSDTDGDTVCGFVDNCPSIANPTQRDRNRDGVGDSCTCAADCNGDGNVFGTEVTTAVQIWGEQVGLHVCPIADADDDGRVQMDDIVKAVENLGLGCTQFDAAGGNPGQGGGAGAGAGASVGIWPKDSQAIATAFFDIPLEVSGSGGNVTAVQLDLEYEPLAFEIADPSVDCTIDPSIGASHVLTAFAVSDAPNGWSRLRIGIRDPSGTAPLADGIVGKCKFKMLLTSGPGGLILGTGTQAVSTSVAVLPSFSANAFVTFCPGCTCN